MGGMGISGRTEAMLKQILARTKPKRVVDLGTGEGRSLAAFIETVPPTTDIYSVDHNRKYFNVAKNLLKERNIDGSGAVFVLAPLENSKKHGQMWFNEDALASIPGPIDILFVDGPEGAYGRYPALEVFYDRLAPNGRVYMDDVKRDGEMGAFVRWTDFLRTKHREFSAEVLETDRGLGEIVLKGSIQQILKESQSDKESVSHSYGEPYDRHFGHFRDKEATILEIGVHKGDSIKAWRKYFEKAAIHGIDIREKALQAGGKNSYVWIGDQSDEQFLNRVLRVTGPLDIVIDDGSHMMKHQRFSFLMLFPHLKPGGIYVIEDLGTSYHAYYGGGKEAAKNNQTTMCLLKEMLDEVNRKRSNMYEMPSISEFHLYPEISFIVRGDDA